MPGYCSGFIHTALEIPTENMFAFWTLHSECAGQFLPRPSIFLLSYSSSTSYIRQPAYFCNTLYAFSVNYRIIFYKLRSSQHEKLVNSIFCTYYVVCISWVLNSTWKDKPSIMANLIFLLYFWGSSRNLSVGTRQTDLIKRSVSDQIAWTKYYLGLSKLWKPSDHSILYIFGQLNEVS